MIQYHEIFENGIHYAHSKTLCQEDCVTKHCKKGLHVACGNTNCACDCHN